MGTPTQVCVWSCPNFSAPAGRPFRMSTLVFVNPESSTQADGAQSSRVPPFEDPIETETPESPLTIAPPVLVPILHRTACMAMRVPPAMSSGLSTSMAEVAAMSEFAFRKRFRSSYKSLPSLSPSDLSSRKRYRGTSELVEDSEEGDDAKDEEIEESMDSDNVSEDAEDEGPIAKDEDPAVGDEGLTARVKGPGMDDESYDLDDGSHGLDDGSHGLDDGSHGSDDGSHSLDDESHGMDDESRGLDDEGHGVESDGLGLEEEEEVVPGGQQKAAPVVGIAMSAPLGLGYRALRHRELELEEDHPTLTTWTDPEDGMVYIDVPAYPPPAPHVQTPPSHE
ncbi:hypothetical protein Tco_0926766 [Tanacetum coccineum]|uniref:Uncharacterized protein n=1 Tax=Tanacetum coccineum TaxID=301880 RepID=A0ABQ5DDE0_9ASTR